MEEARPIIVEGGMKYEIGDFDINELKLWEDNPRTISKEELERLKKSIKRKPYFMSARPIVLSDRTGEKVIIAGNQRYKAVKELGWAEAPCILFHCETEEQEVEIAMVDNHNNGEWDVQKLSEKFMNYPLEDWLGSDWEKLAGEFGKETKEVKEDEVPEVDDKPAKTKLGDIYQLGKHRLMCGDSTKEEDVEKLMNGEKADMVFTDPPYGVSYTEKNEYLNSLGEGHRLTKAIENDSKTPEEMYEFWVKAFENCVKFTKDTMSYYICSAQGGDLLLLLLLLQAVRDSGFALKHVLIWNKNNHVLGRCDYNYKHEPIVYGWKQNGNHKFYGGGKFKTSVWDIPKPQKSDLHPTMKPVELAANCLLDATEKGGSVLDLFGGSGTTLIAAEQLDRKAYVMELDPKYCDVIVERWEKFTGEKAKKISS